jgi:hypothetical protein
MNQNFVLPFGKYRGDDLIYVAEVNPKYLLWLKSTAKGELKENLDSFINTNYFKDCLLKIEFNNQIEYGDYEPYAFDYLWK